MIEAVQSPLYRFTTTDRRLNKLSRAIQINVRQGLEARLTNRDMREVRIDDSPLPHV